MSIQYGIANWGGTRFVRLVDEIVRGIKDDHDSFKMTLIYGLNYVL
jgi:hypothetical protein